jgi:hypothetical protein
MRVAVDVLAPAGELYVQVQDEHILGMMLRPGFNEVGLQRSAIRRVTFQAGEMGFFPRRMERWIGTGHQERLPRSSTLASFPPDLRCKTYGVSIRGPELKASGHPLSQTRGMEPKKR